MGPHQVDYQQMRNWWWQIGFFISQADLLSVIAGLQHDVPQRQREASQELTQVFTKSLGSITQSRKTGAQFQHKEIESFREHPCLWQCQVTPQCCKFPLHTWSSKNKPGNNDSIVPKLNLPSVRTSSLAPQLNVPFVAWHWKALLCRLPTCCSSVMDSCQKSKRDVWLSWWDTSWASHMQQTCINMLYFSLAKSGQEPKILRTSPIRMAADFSFGGLIWQTKPREKHVASPSGWQSHAEMCLLSHPLKMWSCTLKAQRSYGSNSDTMWHSHAEAFRHAESRDAFGENAMSQPGTIAQTRVIDPFLCRKKRNPKSHYFPEHPQLPWII